MLKDREALDDSLDQDGYSWLPIGAGNERVTITSAKLKGYRAFAEFEMADLGRVNLLVGRNNTGKSSILEALFMLASGRNPGSLWNVLARRGEQILPDAQPNRPQFGEADVSHLFHGHEMRVGSEFSLVTKNSPGRSITCRVGMATAEQNAQAFLQFQDEGNVAERLALFITGDPHFEIPPIPLSKNGTLRSEVVQPYAVARIPNIDATPAQFIATESLNIQQIAQLWSSIVLTPAEDRVVEALQILDPNVERIAQVPLGMMQIPGAGITMPPRGGFFVRMKGSAARVPIGSFGDGMWRMLALSVALARANDGVLLIDEIDTGLHHSVMSDMWKLVNEASKAFGVQVFATTHSYDCVHALATVCRDVDNRSSEITIHRIEPGRSRSVPFTESEIIAAADRKIELR